MISKQQLPKLDDISTCTGCKLCGYVCSQKAISFVPNRLGFEYPQIDVSKCIGCKKCERSCPNLVPVAKHSEIAAYAATVNGHEKLMSSASGGVFIALAEAVIKEKGIVYGAVMEADNISILRVLHKRAENYEQAQRMQRSKYVQSDMDSVYKQIAMDLATNKTVLFTGTPCQAASVKQLFGNEPKLIVVDIICHGVPSQQLFSDYLNVIRRKNEEIQGFDFRSKESGWGLCASLTIKSPQMGTHTKRIPSQISSYYQMFLHGESYRDCCYNCRYATRERCGDITLGDYWGVQKYEDLYRRCTSLGMNAVEGISCVLVHTEKGAKLLQSADLSLVETEYKRIAKENHQLYKPSEKSPEREEIIRIYSTYGYKVVEQKFNKRLGYRKFIISARKCIPPSLRMKIRMLMGK